METLNDDCFRSILSFFDFKQKMNLRGVSKRFRDMIHSDYFIRSVECRAITGYPPIFYQTTINIDDKYTMYLFTRFKKIIFFTMDSQQDRYSESYLKTFHEMIRYRKYGGMENI